MFITETKLVARSLCQAFRDLERLGAHVGVVLPVWPGYGQDGSSLKAALSCVQTAHRTAVCAYSRLVDSYARQRALLIVESDHHGNGGATVDVLAQNAGSAEMAIWEATACAVEHAGYTAFIEQLQAVAIEEQELVEQFAAQYRDLVWLMVELKAWQSLTETAVGRFLGKDYLAFQRTLTVTVNSSLAAIPLASGVVEDTQDTMVLAA